MHCKRQTTQCSLVYIKLYKYLFSFSSSTVYTYVTTEQFFLYKIAHIYYYTLRILCIILLHNHTGTKNTIINTFYRYSIYYTQHTIHTHVILLSIYIYLYCTSEKFHNTNLCIISYVYVICNDTLEQFRKYNILQGRFTLHTFLSKFQSVS